MSNFIMKIILLMFLTFEYSTSLRMGKQLRPIIGIIAQEKGNRNFTSNLVASDTFIAASYVRFIEMAGAQTVPIHPSYSDNKKRGILSKINGVILPGGSSKLNDSIYLDTATFIYKYAMELNNAGVYFPLFGTCLGFELLLVLASHFEIFTPTDAKNYSIPLNFTEEAYGSRMFKNMDLQLLKASMVENVSMHNHRKGVLFSLYNKDVKMKSMYKVLSTSKDRNGQDFISTIEGIHYPFYGTQWHPEKSIFEWTEEENISHSKHAVRIAQHISNFFVGESRKNSHHFKDFQEERSMVMSRYSPVYTGDTSMYQQVYLFRNNTSINGYVNLNSEI